MNKSHDFIVDDEFHVTEEGGDKGVYQEINGIYKNNQV